MSRQGRRRRGTGSRRTPDAAGTTGQPPRDRVLRVAVAVVLLALAAMADDRHVGQIADGRQMIRTAVALVETGGLGQAVGRDFTLERPSGDAISRFGMATSLLQVPAAWLAPSIEARLGAGSSQALFLIVPWLFVGVAAGAAGALTRRLGGDDVEVIAAVCLASIASPLGSYAALEFSEPVQAAALTLALATAFTAASRARQRPALELAAGAAAGAAVLAKSSLIVVAPLAMLPLIDISNMARTRGAVLRAALGAAAPLAAWTAFEFARFGQLFGGYPDDRFTHPWFDGLWRLTVGPNRGLFLFWPAVALFAWAGMSRLRAGFAAPATRAWVAAAGMLAMQLAIAAGYWGWHGMEGWGPRLVVAAIPALAAFAAIAPGPARRPMLLGAVAACLVINMLPLVQHPTPVATYESNVAWPVVPDDERGRYPFYATSSDDEGRQTVIPFAMLDREASANPWALYFWFWRATRLEGQALVDRLMAPPWQDARPDLVPPAEWTPDVARRVAPPPRWGFLGRSLTGTGGPYDSVYLEALLDQVVRANQQGMVDRAVSLSARRLDLSADGEAAAWRLESLRRAGRPVDAESTLRALPVSSRQHPLINVVLALFDRDAGEETRARALLGSVASAFPGAPLQSAVNAPLAAWPATLDAMTRVPRRDATVAR